MVEGEVNLYERWDLGEEGRDGAGEGVPREEEDGEASEAGEGGWDVADEEGELMKL